MAIAFKTEQAPIEDGMPQAFYLSTTVREAVF